MNPTLDMALRGAAAGAVGTLVMTAVEKLEQALTGRPSSYMPAASTARLLRLPEKPDTERTALNLTMHAFWGIAGGVLRAFMARRGIRGPFASYMFTGARLSIDQTLENAAGVGAPPWTWPRDEQVIDLLHKGVYALVTGALVDRWVAPAPGRERPARPAPRRGWTPGRLPAQGPSRTGAVPAR